VQKPKPITKFKPQQGNKRNEAELKWGRGCKVSLQTIAIY